MAPPIIRLAVLLLPLALALGAAVSPAAGSQELTLSVAISMKDAVEELGRRFTQARPGVVLRYNFGASGELARQIEAGAPVDLFISAATRQMDELEGQGLIAPGSRRVFARNTLVAVTPADSALALAGPGDLLDPRGRKIAVGNPRTVPAGQYTEESLRALGLWERLGPKLVFAGNVRQVLDYVVRGEVEVGFVYATDARARPGQVREAFRPPEHTYGPIVYPAAVVRDSRHRALAQALVDLLVSADGQAVLKRVGFRPPPADAR